MNTGDYIAISIVVVLAVYLFSFVLKDKSR